MLEPPTKLKSEGKQNTCTLRIRSEIFAKCSTPSASARSKNCSKFPTRLRSKRRSTSFRRFPNIKSRAVSSSLRAKNTGVDYVSFLGAGAYRHYAPPAIARAGDARRIPHRVHAVSSRSIARLPSGDLRVADLHLLAHRHGHRQRVGVRRRDGAGRSRHHGAERERPEENSRFARDSSELPRGAENVLRRSGSRDRRSAAQRRRHDRHGSAPRRGRHESSTRRLRADRRTSSATSKR